MPIIRHPTNRHFDIIKALEAHAKQLPGIFWYHAGIRLIHYPASHRTAWFDNSGPITKKSAVYRLSRLKVQPEPELDGMGNPLDGGPLE